MKNRMREIRTSGSVRGGDGNIPTYSADFRQTSDEEVIAAMARYSSQAKVGEAMSVREPAKGSSSSSDSADQASRAKDYD